MRLHDDGNENSNWIMIMERLGISGSISIIVQFISAFALSLSPSSMNCVFFLGKLKIEKKWEKWNIQKVIIKINRFCCELNLSELSELNIVGVKNWY